MHAQFRDIVVAFDARRFLESIGQHRLFPEVVVGVAVMFPPFLIDDRIVGGVRCVLKTGSRSLTVVADRATEFLLRMRAACRDEKIGAGMRTKRMGVFVGGEFRNAARDNTVGRLMAGNAAVKTGDVLGASQIDRHFR